MGASGRAGPDPLFLQNPASAERSAGVRRENSSLQRLYCPGKGSEWVISHNRGKGLF